MIEPTRSVLTPLCQCSAVPSFGQNRSDSGYSTLQLGQTLSALTTLSAGSGGGGCGGGGRARRGVPGERLGLPIVIVVRDASGAAVAGVRVTWVAEDGGAIDPAESVTDVEGSAAATWTLGGNSTTTLHRGRAIATGFAFVEFTASTSAAGQLPLDIVQPLDLQTFDRSGQTVHPDYVATAAQWA